MFPATIPTHPHEYFTNEDDFPNPLMIVNGFSYKDTLVGMHSQEFIEINIVLAGSGMHYIKNRCLPAKPGDVFFILPDYTHGYLGNKDFEVYNLTIHKRFIDKYLIDLQALPSFSILFESEPLLRTIDSAPLHLSLTPQQLASLQFLMQEIHRLSNPETYAAALMCNSLVVAFISNLCVFYKENMGNSERHKSKDDEALLMALSQIHENYRENISIDDLAEIAHLSRSALNRRFHEVCGMSPHKYLVKKRIEVAMHYLENSNLSLTEIAENSGFYDTAHFTRIFKAETGSSPINYRKKLLHID